MLWRRLDADGSGEAPVEIGVMKLSHVISSMSSLRHVGSAGLPRRVCPPHVQVSHAHWDLGLSGEIEEIVHVPTATHL